MALGNLAAGAEQVIGHLGPQYTWQARQENLRAMPHVVGYELDQKWWDSDVETMKRAFLDIFDKVKGGWWEDASAGMRAAYSPAALARKMKPRFEHIKDVLDGSGW